jgi:transposase-like protein
MGDRHGVEYTRKVFSHVARGKVRAVVRMLKEDLTAARDKAKAVIDKLNEMRLSKAADLVDNHLDETLAYYGFRRSIG